MKKFGMALSLAAVATLVGCKDPNYKYADKTTASQEEVKNVDTTPAKPVAEVVVEKPKCKCPANTRHTSPCACGAEDCMCIVEEKSVATTDISKPAEPEYTIYSVQRGDYLSKISKKYNVTIASIKRLNPSIKNDVVRIGQKLKLPGKIDVGTQVEPAKAPKVAKPAKKAFSPYKGATKEYVVKSGDTLGAIAYGSGINIRQLKKLNSLSSDSIKVGQKLKVPAEKVVKATKSVSENKKVAVAVVAEKKPVEKVEEKPAQTVESSTAATAEAPSATTEQATPVDTPTVAEAPATTTYVVKEGDDITGVSIRWGVSAADIRELNNLAESDQLVPGQVIKLPADAQQ